jgi:hypothetical protein
VMSAQVEHKQKLPPSDYFFQFRNIEIIILHVAAYSVAITLLFMPLKTIPSLYYCSSPNPCSCPSFYVYQQLCESIKYSNSTVNGDNNYVVGINNVTTPVIDSASSIMSITGSDGAIKLLSILGAIGICILAYLFINRHSNYQRLKNIHSILEKEKKMNKVLADVASSGLKETSALQQAIATIEALSRGASPAQTILLQNVVKILRAPSKITNVDIDRVLKTSSTDADVVTYLKSQLMNQEEFQITQQVSGETSVKTGSGRRASLQLTSALNVNAIVKKVATPQLTTRSIGNTTDPQENTHSSLLILDYRLADTHDRSSFANITSWEFNIFGLSVKTPLASLAWECFTVSNMIKDLNLPAYQLQNMLLHIEENYSMSDYEVNSGYGDSFSREIGSKLKLEKDAGMIRRDHEGMSRNDESRMKRVNPYHNNLHGADVMQSVFFLTLHHKAIGGGFTSLDFFCLLFAACIHDANHPGLNTTFVVNDWPVSCISAAFGTEVFSNCLLFVPSTYNNLSILTLYGHI